MTAIAALSSRAAFWLGSQSPIHIRLARNSVWAVAGTAFAQGSSLLAAVTLGRLLGVHDFGNLALIQVTLLLLGNLGDAGLSLTTTKFTAQWRSGDPERVGNLLGWSSRVTGGLAIGLALLLAAFGPYLATPSSPAMTAGIRIGCLLLIFDMMNRLQLGALAGFEAFAAATRIHIARGLLVLPCTWIGARYWGLPGGVAALAAASGAAMVVGRLTLRQECAARSIPYGWQGVREPGIVKTSASLWMCMVLASVSSWLVSVALTRQPGGVVELGLFNAADKWKAAMVFLPNVLFQVILPMLSNNHASGDRKACARILKLALAAVTVTTGTIALALAAASEWFMGSFGPGFAAGANVLTLGGICAMVTGIHVVSSGALWAIGRPGQMLKLDALKTAALLIPCLAGFIGSAYQLMLAYLGSFAVGSILVLLSVRRQLRTNE